MAHLKIKFWNLFFDRVSPLLASKGSKKHLLGHISSFECCNLWGCGGVVVCGCVGVWVCGGGSPCVRTFQGLHSVRLWTPTI
jgi:hypothetical protein